MTIIHFDCLLLVWCVNSQKANYVYKTKYKKKNTIINIKGNKEFIKNYTNALQLLLRAVIFFNVSVPTLPVPLLLSPTTPTFPLLLRTRKSPENDSTVESYPWIYITGVWLKRFKPNLGSSLIFQYS